jgi:hypothetical protein
MTTTRSDIPPPDDLAAAESVLRANLDQLRHWSGEPTAAQVAAVKAVEGFILTATEQQTRWGWLRLIGYRGYILAENPTAGERSSPEKNVGRRHFTANLCRSRRY